VLVIFRKGGASAAETSQRQRPLEPPGVSRHHGTDTGFRARKRVSLKKNYGPGRLHVTTFSVG
jgi:hypothetical protein